MKQLIYSALIGTLALAVSAQGADNKHPQKKGGRGAPSAQRGAAQAKANVHRGGNAVRAQSRAVNPGRNHAATVRASRPQGHVAPTVRQSTAQVAPTQQRVTTRERKNGRNAQVAAQQNTSVRAQGNAAVNRHGNLRPRTHRNVAVVNNWNGSRYSGQQYAAFRNYHRERHGRDWYRSRYPRIVLFGGGNYYWNNGYWYPAWGYDSGYDYGYDGPIYGYNNLDPQQVVVNVQAALQEAGYYNGSIDGALGPMTRGALAAFQADQGLAVTSAIDQPTLATLGLI